MVRGGFLLSFVLALVGCGQARSTSPQTLDGLAAGIVNGTNVTTPDALSQHVVFLQVKLSDGIGDCTGTILDSQTILTAAHCVSGATQAVIVFANNVQNPQAVSASQVRAVDVAAIYPTYQPDDEDSDSSDRSDAQAATPPPPGPQDIPTVAEVQQSLDAEGAFDNDIAMVHFEGGLPAGYTPVQLATSPSLAQAGAELHMIGYGLSEVDAKTETVKGKTEVVPVPDQSTVGQLRETEVPIAVYDTKVGMILTDSTKTGVCSGDSGGPAFVQDPSTGNMVQVGIAEAVATAYCNSVSMHTAVFPYLKWIQQTAAKMAQEAQQNANANPNSNSNPNPNSNLHGRDISFTSLQ